jgi:NAD(P)-dependent dehydrogenase (short-subunit alcohol dehydrogenase family)
MSSSSTASESLVFVVSGACRGLGYEIVRAGQRVVAAVDEPPLRLLVGADAYAYATAAGRALLAEDERSRDLSESTTADDASAEHLDPLGHR